jgi:2-deoxy-D-gluconate 3-dehydrogenase
MGVDFSLQGRVAIVTGGSSGLGKAIAESFIEQGVSVVLVDMNESKNAAVAAALGERCIAFPADVRKEELAEAAVALAIERFGKLDILVNCAGIARGAPFLEIKTQDWHDVLDTHLTGSMLWGRTAARAMVAQGTGGKIINVGSMTSVFGVEGAIDYAAAKSGMIGLTRSQAVALGPHNIQVNAIMPGWIITPMTTQEFQDGPIGQGITKRTPAGRWGNPPEVAGPVSFLASPASDFVTGIALPIDGGFSICCLAYE